MNFQSRKRKFQDIFDEISKKWHSVNDEDNEDTLVFTMYDDYMKLPFSSHQWETQLRGFIENFEFSCAWADSMFM